MEFFLNLVNFIGIFSEIPLNSAIVLLQKQPYFGIVYLDLVVVAAVVVASHFKRAKLIGQNISTWNYRPIGFLLLNQLRKSQL